MLIKQLLTKYPFFSKLPHRVTKIVILNVKLELFRPTASSLEILWQGHIRNLLFHFFQLWGFKHILATVLWTYQNVHLIFYSFTKIVFFFHFWKLWGFKRILETVPWTYQDVHFIFYSFSPNGYQWRSQGLPGWATRPPGGPKWGRK